MSIENWNQCQDSEPKRRRGTQLRPEFITGYSLKSPQNGRMRSQFTSQSLKRLRGRELIELQNTHSVQAFRQTVENRQEVRESNDLCAQDLGDKAARCS